MQKLIFRGKATQLLHFHCYWSVNKLLLLRIDSGTRIRIRIRYSFTEVQILIEMSKIQICELKMKYIFAFDFQSLLQVLKNDFKISSNNDYLERESMREQSFLLFFSTFRESEIRVEPPSYRRFYLSIFIDRIS